LGEDEKQDFHKDHQFNLRLPEGLRKCIERDAKRNGETLSGFMRRVLAAEVNRLAWMRRLKREGAENAKGNNRSKVQVP